MEIFENLNPNTTIITPNHSLTTRLYEEYKLFQINKKKSFWLTIDILPYNSWLQRLWREISILEMNDQQVILSSEQELTIWENIINIIGPNDFILKIRDAADLAKKAFGIINQWKININNDYQSDTTDTITFQKWAIEFQKYCKKNNFLDQHSLPLSIITHVKSNTLKFQNEIILAGFTELTPIQKDLFAEYDKTYSKVKILDEINYLNLTTNKKKSYISLNDTETEILTAARWAKNLSDSTNNKKIACVIPNIESNRDLVLNIFSEVLPNKNFNISIGKNLIEYPVINAAIKILSSSKNKIEFKDLSFLLHSPFLGESEKELVQRSMYDSYLRSNNINYIYLTKLQESNTLKYCEYLSRRLTNLSNLLEIQKNKFLPSQWADHSIEILNILGWPGEKSLSSEEHLVTKKFLDTLNEYKTFNTITGKICFEEALKQIEEIISKTIFQPQSSGSKIEILGILEASTLPFDHTWVIGLDDTSWPPPPKPNPFIPYTLQRKLQLPNSTAEKELSYSKKITSQLSNNTNNIIFSYPQKKENSEVRPSPLIKDFTKITLHKIYLPKFKKNIETIFNSQIFEYLTDENGATINSKEKISGGVSIIKRQSLCPFKSYSETRLHAYKLQTLTSGLRPQDKGNIIHSALEYIWQEIKDYSSLIALNESDARVIINKSIINSFKKFKLNTNERKNYFSIEKTRLTELLLKWINKEKTRPKFEIISFETQEKINLSNLCLNLRIDRIDKTVGGEYIIIDYKTGKHNYIKNWFSSRPEDPQLPLYCLINPDKIQAIAYGEINTTNISIHGISKDYINTDKIKKFDEVKYHNEESFTKLIQFWKQTFNTIAKEFLQGVSTVTPKNKIETCKFCDLKSLCRINQYQV
ncbi:PD-(D/E)XK nuclease family protein [Gammaproteobacteria bacterium]|nr:PD-(D/E)XK nuclease family protein [Gammaproteobacteria bacterium]